MQCRRGFSLFSFFFVLELFFFFSFGAQC